MTEPAIRRGTRASPRENGTMTRRIACPGMRSFSSTRAERNAAAAPARKSTASSTTEIARPAAGSAGSRPAAASPSWVPRTAVECMVWSRLLSDEKECADLSFRAHSHVRETINWEVVSPALQCASPAAVGYNQSDPCPLRRLLDAPRNPWTTHQAGHRHAACQGLAGDQRHLRLRLGRG